eukprot:Plantae.Rhodophyta-Hildenbrandia_rubra.ctg22272.p1 GENE.Plantae.Rhodophyta-Hildenbrandia_rubra.ctg22272~~Plantae.Rhodophyta-Hildenbrandia_rubra.ctg22272.p1  ORF type:complete len:649 (-),score=115.79 Plantae.Rhodophyta-Hildenbrandia_rubra.ctg22272:1362-3308(-)
MAATLTQTPRKGWATSRPAQLTREVPTDIEIAQSVRPIPIKEIASACGIQQDELEPYGRYLAKVNISIKERLKGNPDGKLVVIGGITPTPLGEGKSTVTVGLGQALGTWSGRQAIICMRQPSMGPTFGLKGGAAGGGYSQVLPMEEFNLHLTGDVHAIGAANNLLAAALDTRMWHEARQTDEALFRRLCPKDKDGKRSFAKGLKYRLRKLGIHKDDPDQLTNEEISKFSRLDIDPASVTWRRVVDCNDRSLRQVTIGQSPTEKGITRETGWSITVASEIMAILALATDYRDLRKRLGAIVVGVSRRDGEFITADDLGIGGALTVIMKDALFPNLLQTIEGTPVLIHAGPFANIAQGTSSLVATQIGLKLVGKDGFLLTEAGFGSDIGLEKFMNIKCRAGNLRPACAVIVASIRALKMHGGGPAVTAGTPLSPIYLSENAEMLRAGCVNLKRHIQNAVAHGVPVIVAINKFKTDSSLELNVLKKQALAAGAVDAVVTNNWAEGGKGAWKLGEAIIKATENSDLQKFRHTYELDSSLSEKIEAIAKKVYKANKVKFSEEAKKKLSLYEKKGFGRLPVCIAKTQYSFSADPSLKGAPIGFTLPIRDVRLSAGAGFIYPLCGSISTMPGLPTKPAYFDMDIDVETGKVLGLS